MDEDDAVQNVSGNGGQNIQAGKKSRIKAKQKTVIVNPPTVEKAVDPAPEYDVRWSWRSPLTQAVLTWIGTITGLIGLGQAAGLVFVGTGALRGEAGLSQFGDLPPWIPVAFVSVFFVAVLVAVCAWSLRRIVKLKLRVMPNTSLLPGALGDDGSVVFQYLRGTCPCGGKLRFYNKPVSWDRILMSDGSERRKVTKRALACECTRNSDHWWTIDSAERPLI